MSARSAIAEPVAAAGIELVAVDRLRHIEAFSPRRVDRLARKIADEGLWIRPLALDDTHDLVLDGQHRMEVAKRLGLAVVPAVRFRYADLTIWSLREGIDFTWETVVDRALAGEIYPYKTVKHAFEGGLPACCYRLDELKEAR